MVYELLGGGLPACRIEPSFSWASYPSRLGEESTLEQQLEYQESYNGKMANDYHRMKEQ